MPWYLYCNECLISVMGLVVINVTFLVILSLATREQLGY